MSKQYGIVTDSKFSLHNKTNAAVCENPAPAPTPGSNPPVPKPKPRVPAAKRSSLFRDASSVNPPKKRKRPLPDVGRPIRKPPYPERKPVFSRPQAHPDPTPAPPFSAFRKKAKPIFGQRFHKRKPEIPKPKPIVPK